MMDYKVREIACCDSGGKSGAFGHVFVTRGLNFATNFLSASSHCTIHARTLDRALGFAANVLLKYMKCIVKKT